MKSTLRARHANPLQGAFDWLNKALVTVYKVVGFIVLGFVVLGLLSYIALHAFYFVHMRWSVPSIISPSDPRVLDLSARFAQESALREKLLAERADLEIKRQVSARTLEVEQRFLEEMRPALQLELRRRQRTVKHLRDLQQRFNRAHGDLDASTRAITGVSRDRLGKQYEAKLIDQAGLVAQNLNLAQVASASVAMDQRGIELDSQLYKLADEVGSLEAVTSERAAGARGLTPEIAQLVHDLDIVAARVSAEHLNQLSLVRAREALDRGVARYDSLLVQIQGSSLLKAVRGKLAVAFVPYENMAYAKAGTPVYGCLLHVIVCSKVGQVRGPLEGEVKVQHPVYHTDIRGQMVELEIDEIAGAQEPVLHLARAPFGF